jgi:hypothetical protein
MNETAPGGAPEPGRHSLRSTAFVRRTGRRALAVAQADDACWQQSQTGTGVEYDNRQTMLLGLRYG